MLAAEQVSTIDDINPRTYRRWFGTDNDALGINNNNNNNNDNDDDDSKEKEKIRLRELIVQNLDGLKSCTICLDTCPLKYFIWFPCNHFACVFCFLRLQSTNICPYCRQEVIEDQEKMVIAQDSIREQFDYYRRILQIANDDNDNDNDENDGMGEEDDDDDDEDALQNLLQRYFGHRYDDVVQSLVYQFGQVYTVIELEDPSCFQTISKAKIEQCIRDECECENTTNITTTTVSNEIREKIQSLVADMKSKEVNILSLNGNDDIDERRHRMRVQIGTTAMIILHTIAAYTESPTTVLTIFDRVFEHYAATGILEEVFSD